jgi:glutaredoxin 2
MKLYVYDHCPYCVKARIIFALKNISFELVTLLNDDIATPTKMIGTKMVPILELDDGTYMSESMDIIHYIDENYGEKQIIIKTNNLEIETWLNKISGFTYKLAMPRWVNAPLQEFASAPARNYFIEKKNQLHRRFSRTH